MYLLEDELENYIHLHVATAPLAKSTYTLCDSTGSCIDSHCSVTVPAYVMCTWSLLHCSIKGIDSPDISHMIECRMEAQVWAFCNLTLGIGSRNSRLMSFDIQ